MAIVVRLREELGAVAPADPPEGGTALPGGLDQLPQP